MKNFSQLHSNFNQYNNLVKEAEDLRFRTAIGLVNGNVFCTLFNYETPIILAWRQGVDHTLASRFEIHEANAVIIDKGMYDDERVFEMQAIIESWLASEVAEGVA